MENIKKIVFKGKTVYFFSLPTVSLFPKLTLKPESYIDLLQYFFPTSQTTGSASFSSNYLETPTPWVRPSPNLHLRVSLRVMFKKGTLKSAGAIQNPKNTFRARFRGDNRTLKPIQFWSDDPRR